LRRNKYGSILATAADAAIVEMACRKTFAAIADIRSWVAPMRGKLRILITSLLISLAASTGARADDIFMTLGAAKLTQLSRLLTHILPIFKAASNVGVHVVELDAASAPAVEERNDVNALLLDDTSAVDKAVKDRYGLNPREAMYNDFVIVGPKSDPAGIRGLTDGAKAFAQIAAKGAPFVSGSDDDSHRLELHLWKAASIQIDKQPWYRKLGPGDHSTPEAADAVNGYALVDRATWANFKDRNNLQILTEDDAALINVYDSILVSPDKVAQNKFVLARIWHDWITDKHGAAAISSYKINGEQIFFPCEGSALTLCSAARFRPGP
jgi:tungstate transport system substrate-binding protein